MVIEAISREGLIATTRAILGLSASTNEIDDALLAALLRRAAGILCPCAPSTITTSVLEGLQYLFDDKQQLERRLAERLEQLLIVGDLLELNEVTTDDPSAKGTWVFAAPPSFVERPDGSVFLLGIVPDEATPLPPLLAERVIHEGSLRMLKPESGETLRSVLRTLGWLELSKEAWLKPPRIETASHFRDAMLARLRQQPDCGAIADALILDPLRDLHYYANRWSVPTGHNGLFVARRPQSHGAPLWGYAAVVDGALTQFLDLPLKGTRWRGCDVAWHLQLAIDAGSKRPQTFRCRRSSGGGLLDFFAPLPLWAERRLVVLGRPAPREHCLFTYWIPERELATEEAFLQERLWLTRED